MKIVEDVPTHAQNIINNYNRYSSVTVFRGTRLPLANSSFNNGYMHTTPQFATSAAYAVGISNGLGGIGRLLNKNGEETGIGFIHSYQASLTTKIYKNFQFEKFLNNIGEDSIITLNDFKQELSGFTKLEKESFSIEYFSENRLYETPDKKINMSENMKKWYDFITSTQCFNTPYYEVMLPEESIPQYTFLIDKNTKVIKLDLNNTKIQKVLKKLQSLLIRDFYEILPLEKLVNEIDFNISDIKKSNVNENSQSELFYLIKNEAMLLNELKKSVLDMIDDVKKKSLLSENDIQKIMNTSQMVGETNIIGEPTSKSKINYHKSIEIFINKINDKKKLIEIPLESFFKYKKIVLNSIVLNSNNLNSPSIKLFDKLLNEIREKEIPNNLKIKELDNDGVMLELIINIEKN